jgi:hypothetical protein
MDAVFGRTLHFCSYDHGNAFTVASVSGKNCVKENSPLPPVGASKSLRTRVSALALSVGFAMYS